MFGEWRFVALGVMAFLAGCAEPKYQSVQAVTAETFVQETGLEECSTSFEESGYCLLWAWVKEPTATESGQLIFKVVRPNILDGSPVPVDISFDMELVLWMPKMGHGSSPPSLEQVDVGSYRASNVFFVMPGEWDLRFQLKDEGVLRDEAVVGITI